MSVIKKKKRVSKKNKSAWRKHSDIADVEEYLEDQRLDERLGKFETKPDAELFVVDTQGDDITQETTDIKPDIKPLSAKQKKRAQLSQPPRCFDILLPTSMVQDPNAKRNHVNPVGTKPTALSKLSTKRQYEKGTLAKKFELSKQNKKIAHDRKRKAKSMRQTFDKNLWGGDVLEAKGIPSSLCGEFTSTEAQIHNVPTSMRLRAKPSLPNTMVTRAAVVVPHPGVSYNPSYKEHQELLQNVVQHEQKLMKREAHLNRVTTGMFRKITISEKENQWREEMSAGLPQPHNPTADPQLEESDGEYKPINPPVKNKKKDHKARRKQREQLEEKERLKRAKIEKKKTTDLYRLRKLQTTIKATEQKQIEVSEKRKSKRSEAADTALPALNAKKLPAQEPEFVDPAMLTGDLRNMSHTGNLLRDRFVSLQHRGALAASKIMMKKKKRLKSYFKAGHKVTDQDVERYVQRAAGKK